MTKRAKFLIAGAALALGAMLVWRLYQDASELIVANQPLPAYVPGEEAKETIELWPVQSKGKWGFINRAGEFVIPAQFEMAWEFAEGLAPVQVRQGALRFGNDRKYGFINKTGQMVIQPRLVLEGMPYGFHDGFARIVSKSLRLLRVNWVDAKYGFIDRVGKTVIETKYNFAGDFHEGLARVSRRQVLNRKIKWGFINRKGELVISYEFDFAGDFTEGLVYVQKDGAYYFIDAFSKNVFGKPFENARGFAEGFAPVQINGRWGYINKSGVVAVLPQFRDVRSFSEGLAAVQTMAGTWGFIDREGKTLIPPSYQRAGDFSEGLAQVRLQPGWGLIDKTGKVIVEPQFPAIGKFRNGIAPAGQMNDGRFIITTLLDKSGKIIWRSE